MQRLHWFSFRQRRGVALLLVLFIAFASIVAVTTLFASLAPRRLTVSGEAQSDRALAVADGAVDRVLDLINNTGLSYSQVSHESQQDAGEALVTQLLVGINGGTPSDTYETVSANVRRYFYDTQGDVYYRLESGTAATGTLTNLSSGASVTGGLAGLDANYLTDNRWFEMDTNAQYWINPGVPDTWEIRTTAFNMSTPDIKRTIRAEAQRGDVTLSTSSSTTDTADGNWYVAQQTNQSFFSDYSGMFHSRVYFGKFEVTTGKVRSDSDLYMGGWAKDPVYAHGTVYDQAIDDGYRSDGRFGLDAVGLSTARTRGLANNNQPVANWPNGTAALTTLYNNAKSTAYYVNGNATIVFSVVGGVGKVTINGTQLDLPANGAIYVNGDATVSGTLKGQVTIGAADDVIIGGNILYSRPPRTDVNSPVTDPSLQDKLGLIAQDDIIIPPSTYNANRTLEIDAAMLAVTGYFGLDKNASYSSHSLNSSPHWVGIWNGSQSIYSSDSAPALSSGGSVQGYEEQHTNYDWNLTNGSRPPWFPAADDYVNSVTVFNPYTGNDLATLQTLQRTSLTALSTSDPAWAQNLRYKYVLGGTTYYYGSVFNTATIYTYSGTYGATKNSLYRVSWKEEIAQPLEVP